MKNRYFFISKLDLGPEKTVKSDISSRPIRYIFIIKDNTSKKIIKASEKESIFLISREMCLNTDSPKIKDIWKKIKSKISTKNQKDLLLIQKLISLKGDSSFSSNIYRQILNGKKLTEKQTQAINLTIDKK